jgi:hypothetical protein
VLSLKLRKQELLFLLRPNSDESLSEQINSAVVCQNSQFLKSASVPKNKAHMKPQKVRNTVVDEANQITYIVTADRLLTDGELYSAIRVALLMRGRKRVGRGETLEIATAEKA